MSDDDDVIGRAAKVPGLVGTMIDKEVLERLAQPGVSRRVWMYRAGESRIFDDYNDIPAGEGWVDSPAKVGLVVEPEPQTPAETAPTEEMPKFLTSKGRKKSASV